MTEESQEKARVLVVDDAASMRGLISLSLNNLGCDVVGQAESGVDGVKI